jgi:hypothetical protein
MQNVDWEFPIYIKKVVCNRNYKLEDLANPIESNSATRHS